MLGWIAAIGGVDICWNDGVDNVPKLIYLHLTDSSFWDKSSGVIWETGKFRSGVS